MYRDGYKMHRQVQFQGRIVRSNLEVKNGYIHLVDTVLIDNSPVVRFLNSTNSLNNSNVVLLVLSVFLWALVH